MQHPHHSCYLQHRILHTIAHNERKTISHFPVRSEIATSEYMLKQIRPLWSVTNKFFFFHVNLQKLYVATLKSCIFDKDRWTLREHDVQRWSCNLCFTRSTSISIPCSAIMYRCVATFSSMSSLCLYKQNILQYRWSTNSRSVALVHHLSPYTYRTSDVPHSAKYSQVHLNV